MIYLFNRDLTGRKTLASVESLEWTERYASIGTFTLVAGDTDENAQILRNGKILYYEGHAGIIERTEFSGGKIQANGHSLAVILNQRTVFNEIAFENVESGLYSAWNANSRGMDVETAPAKGLEAVYRSTQVDKAFGQMTAEICGPCGLGFRVYLDPKRGKKVFEVYQGKNLSEIGDPKGVVFSTSRGNLTEIEIEADDSDLCNVAYVVGEDLNENRILEVVGAGSGADRREISVVTSLQQEASQPVFDASGAKIGDKPAETDTEFRLRLRGEGLAELDKRLSRTSFSVSVSPEDFGKRFNLGDTVRCYSERYGLHLNARVTAVKYTIDTKRSTVELVLGNPRLTMKERLKLWLK